jgi:penicillin-binding protein-related factor A (putative recombinase)
MFQRKLARTVIIQEGVNKMANNRGKQFEDRIKESFEKVKNVSIDRLHDQTTGYLGSSNCCDFIVYREPKIFYLECKSVHGNRLSISSIPKVDKNGIPHGFHGAITDEQWRGLLKKSQIPGVTAGIICWWVEKDVTLFLPIQTLLGMYNAGLKSVRYDCLDDFDGHTDIVKIKGRKKRVFFDYDMEEFLNGF